MNSFKVRVMVIALALAATCGTGANPATPQPGPASGAVETEIKRLEQMEVKAFLERDIPTL